jgi:hypothetical protein
MMHHFTQSNAFQPFVCLCVFFFLHLVCLLVCSLKREIGGLPSTVDRSSLTLNEAEQQKKLDMERTREAASKSHAGPASTDLSTKSRRTTLSPTGTLPRVSRADATSVVTSGKLPGTDDAQQTAASSPSPLSTSIELTPVATVTPSNPVITSMFER